MNNSCLVGAPTGTAAFNVNGETIHSLTGMTCDDNDSDTIVLSESRKESLVHKFKDCFILIFDERSMIPNSSLGKAERLVSETVYEGQNHSSVHSWGGIPVVLVAGDDCQLGAMGECAPDILPPFTTYKADKAILRGRQLWKEFATTVYKLPTVRRVDESRQRDRDLLDRVRIGEGVQDSDVKRSQNLHLNTISMRHGQKAVDDILKNAIHLFYRNRHRTNHNLVQLSEMNTEDNPTAILKA